MSKYFVVLTGIDGVLAGQGTDGALELFDSVLAAEQKLATPGVLLNGETYEVYDITKFEAPVPLVASGTPMLVNGQWVVSK